MVHFHNLIQECIWVGTMNVFEDLMDDVFSSFL